MVGRGVGVLTRYSDPHMQPSGCSCAQYSSARLLLQEHLHAFWTQIRKPGQRGAQFILMLHQVRVYRFAYHLRLFARLDGREQAEIGDLILVQVRVVLLATGFCTWH